MRWWVVVLISGCVRPSGAFVCNDSSQCTVGGTCEPTGFCSFLDDGCAGRRYSEAAGNGLANTCVGGESDAGVPVCGNNVIEAGEDCDDGNTQDGDTCNSLCLDCSGDATVVANGHCYFRINTAVNQATARADCVTRKGHLITYESMAENTIGVNLMVGGPVGTYWMGLEIAANATQSWVDGTPVTFTNFVAGEPDDPAGSRCVDQTTAGLWGDEVCTRTHAYLCEREP